MWVITQSTAASAAHVHRGATLGRARTEHGQSKQRWTNLSFVDNNPFAAAVCNRQLQVWVGLGKEAPVFLVQGCATEVQRGITCCVYVFACRVSTCEYMRDACFFFFYCLNVRTMQR